MIIIPNITQFNLVEDQAVQPDYKTVFPNQGTAQPTRRLMNPRWVQKVPTDVDIVFQVWTDDISNFGVFVSKGTGTINAVQETITQNGYTLFTVTLNVSAIGDTEIQVLDSYHTYTSNTFKAVDAFNDEVDVWALIEYKHNRSAFDYYFTSTYFRIWVQLSDQEEENDSTIDDYQGDSDKITVTRSVFNENTILETSPSDYWFSKKLANIFLCSDLKVNGIEYAPSGQASVNKLEEGVNQSNLEVTLQKK